MTSGSSQGLFVIVAVVIFGIFVLISYILFRDNLKTGLSSVFEDSIAITEENMNRNLMEQLSLEGFIYNKEEMIKGVTPLQLLEKYKYRPNLVNEFRSDEGRVKGLSKNSAEIVIEEGDDINGLFLHLPLEDISEHTEVVLSYDVRVLEDTKNISTTIAQINVENIAVEKSLASKVYRDLKKGDTFRWEQTIPVEKITMDSIKSYTMVNSTGHIEVSNIRTILK